MSSTIHAATATTDTLRLVLAAAPITGDTPSRTIAGVAVPYGVVGRVADGRRVTFEPGSLDAAARPPVLRDHDRTRAIGRVTDAVDTPSELRATARVSATPLGDETLILAADGATATFSVGVEPIDAAEDADGVLHVYSGEWVELSVVAVGAFTAPIEQVAAGGRLELVCAADGTDLLEVAGESPEGDPDDPDDGDGEGDDPPTVEAAAGRHPAAPRPVPVAPARRRSTGSPYANVGIRQVAQLMHAARHDPAARRTLAGVLAAGGPTSIDAALSDITLVGTDNVSLAYRPAYQAELVELISWGTPLVDALRQGDLQRGDYPTKTFNRWSKTPEVAEQVAEKDEIHSAPVAIVPDSCDVHTWAGGNDISQQTLDLGSPSFVEDYIRAAGMDYAKKIDTFACTTLLAAATPVTTVAGDSFIEVVGKLFGGLSPATTPPGGLFLATSYDVSVGLIGVPRDEGPAFWDGSVSFSTFAPTTQVGGLTVFTDPNLPARTYLLGHRQGATWYDLPGTPFNLRAVNVGLLGLDVAVYGYGALGVQYDGAFAKTTQPGGATVAKSSS